MTMFAIGIFGARRRPPRVRLILAAALLLLLVAGIATATYIGVRAATHENGAHVARATTHENGADVVRSATHQNGPLTLIESGVSTIGADFDGRSWSPTGRS